MHTDAPTSSRSHHQALARVAAWIAPMAAVLVWGIALGISISRSGGEPQMAPAGITIPTQIPRGIIVGWDCPPKKASAAPESGDGEEGEAEQEPVDPCPPPEGWARAELPKVFWQFNTENDGMVDGLVVCTKGEDPPEVEEATFTRLPVRRVGTGWQPTDAAKKLVWMRWQPRASDASKLHPGMLVGWLVSSDCFVKLPGQLEIPAPRHWFIKE